MALCTYDLALPCRLPAGARSDNRAWEILGLRKAVFVDRDCFLPLHLLIQLNQRTELTSCWGDTSHHLVHTYHAYRVMSSTIQEA